MRTPPSSLPQSPLHRSGHSLRGRPLVWCCCSPRCPATDGGGPLARSNARSRGCASTSGRTDAVRAPRDSVALSPDGTRIVFVGRASESGTRQLFTRRLDEQTAQPLPGTTFGASLSMPFFSPAGDWIAFLAGNSLRKVSVQGGSIVEVAGHLVFVRQGTLFAVPFDPTRLETRGTPTPLLNEVGDTGLLEGRGTVHVFDERNIRVLRAPDWYHQLASDLLAECVRSADAAPRSARRVYDAAAIA